jgi:peptide/nickel transport system permease protein
MALGRRRRLIRFLLRRLAAGALLVWLVLTLVFALAQSIPGDTVSRFDDPRVPAAQRDRLRALYGLADPVAVRYGRWLAGVARLDLGLSISRQAPVTTVLGAALGPTLLLCSVALVAQLAVGIAAGVAAARAPGSGRDHAIRLGSLALYAVPAFWLGLVAILLFAVRWPLFPPSHLTSVGAGALGAFDRVVDVLWHLALPAGVLALVGAGGTARFVRAAMIEALGQDFVRTARAKGLTERRVAWRHAFPVAAGPLVQLVGLQLPALVSGALVIEVVFAWPGIGRVAYDGLLARDVPLVLATTALTAAMVVIGSLVADLLHAWIDPRLRATTIADG